MKFTIAMRNMISFTRSFPLKLKLGVPILIFLSILFIMADYISPYDPVRPSSERLYPPSIDHIFGTDNIGRDVLSRVLYGGRTALVTIALSLILSSPLGLLLGLFSLIHNNIDRLLRIIMDTLYGFPAFLMSLTILFALGPGLINLSIAIAIPWIPIFYRTIRSNVVAILGREFIEAAQAFGASYTWIVKKHILPHTWPIFISLVSIQPARILLVAASINFLGFGVVPPTPDWGADIYNGTLVMTKLAWWVILFPGTALLVTSAVLYIVGQGVSEMFQYTQRSKIYLFTKK